MGCAGKIQGLGEKLMQIWIEMNVVTLHKIDETMPQRMSTIINVKGGPMNEMLVYFFGGAGSVCV